MVRKYHNDKLQTNPWHREEESHNNKETQGRQAKQSNQLSLFPIKMIAKLEWTQSNAQQNIEQLQNPTMGESIINESTKIEPPLRTFRTDSSLSKCNQWYQVQFEVICGPSACTRFTRKSIFIGFKKYMIKKYHIHTLQTIQRHLEEEPRSAKSHKTPGTQFE